MVFNYEDIKSLLVSAGKFRIELGLERIQKILTLLGNPQDELSCIHVAGTNGKGSVCAILASVLCSAGKKVGLYTSPHIFKYNERIKINGVAISDEELGGYINEIVFLSEKHDINLTEFEILTAVMFKYFYDNKVEVVVLETGLGGRFDATNVIKKNLCSVITHIDLDHTERLGNTKDKIAFEKAGIIKPNCPCIVSEGYEVYKDVTDELNAPLILIAPFENPEKLALKGLYQQENLSLALAVIREIFPEVTQEIIDIGLKNVKHPFRFQYIEDKNLLIDGAHNPNGISLLKESLDYYFPNQKRRFIFGCLKNKNYEKMVKTLFEAGDEIYFYKFSNQNSCDVSELKRVCLYPSSDFSGISNFEFSQDKLTVVCGSFYMMQEILEKLGVSCNM